MTFWLILEVVIIILVLVPTGVAFITGAPFVPTPLARVRKMLELAKIKPGMKLYDLGCGDGRLVSTAAKHFHADAVGFELSPFVFWIAKIRQFFTGSHGKIYLRDFRKMPLKDADIVMCYLLPKPMEELKMKFEKELPVGAKIISYAFDIPGWKPIHEESRIKEKNYSRILVYEMGRTNEVSTH